MATPGAGMIPLPPTPMSGIQHPPRIIVTPSHRESSMPNGCDHTLDACVTCETSGDTFNENIRQNAPTPQQMADQPQLYTLDQAVVTELPSRMAQPAAENYPTDWIHTLCDCHCGTCCLACWSPCTLYGRTQYRLDNAHNGVDTKDLSSHSSCGLPCWMYCLVHTSLCGCCGLLSVMQHSEVRETYNINGDLAKDFFKGCCFPCCTLMQADREVKERGSHPFAQPPRMAFNLWNNSRNDLADRTSQPGPNPQMVYAPSQSAIIMGQNPETYQGSNGQSSEKPPFYVHSNDQQNQCAQPGFHEYLSAEGSVSLSHRDGDSQSVDIGPLCSPSSESDTSSRTRKSKPNKLQMKTSNVGSVGVKEESGDDKQMERTETVIRRNRSMSLGNFKQKIKGKDSEEPMEKPAGCPFDNPKNFKYWTGGSPQTVEFNARDNSSPPLQQSLLSPQSREHTLVDCNVCKPHNKPALVGHTLNDCPDDDNIGSIKEAVGSDISLTKNTTVKFPLPPTSQHNLEDCDFVPEPSSPQSPRTPAKKLSQHGLEDCFKERVISTSLPPSSPEHNLADCDTDLIHPERKYTEPVFNRENIMYHPHGLGECPTDEAVFIYYGEGKPQKHTIKECVQRKSDSGGDSGVLVTPNPSSQTIITPAPERTPTPDQNVQSMEDGVEEHLRPSITHIPGSYRSEILPPPKKRKSVHNLLSGLGLKQSQPSTELTLPLETQGDSTYDSSSFSPSMYARGNGSILDVRTNSLPIRGNGADSPCSWISTVGGSATEKRRLTISFGTVEKGWGAKWRSGKKAKILEPAFWEGEGES